MVFATLFYKDLKNSIINDVKKAALFHSRIKRGGNFGIPRQVFCYIDYFGLIASGERGTTERATNFIRKYFPQNYKDYAELLIAMWRHGTVHEYAPKSYYVDFADRGEIAVSWVSDNSNNLTSRNKNMKFFSMRSRSNYLRLFINTCQLTDDLLTALSNFMEDCKMNEKYNIQCGERISSHFGFRNYTEIEGKKLQEKVKEQIKLAFQNRSGYSTLSRKGNKLIFRQK